MITTEGKLIDALGGNRAVAAMFGVGHPTVSNWRSRGFPAWAMARLEKAASTLPDQTDPALFKIKEPRRAGAA